MHASVRALLDQIIDYAGLFPPAKLPLEQALNNYLRYKKESPYAWMLGRFVCPAAKLPELLTLANGHADASLLSLTVLGTQSSQADGSNAALLGDMDAVERFYESWGNRTIIDQYELATPTAWHLGKSANWHWGYLRRDLGVFLEAPKGPTWRTNVDRLVEELKSVPSGPEWLLPRFGMKLRCGGVTADAFPTDEAVAFFIERCRSGSLPWKATAGLHHPRRHFDQSLNLWHHGFLNVLGAGLLAWTNALPESDIVSILADRAAQHFHFQEDRISWKNWTCTTEQIAEWRLLATSFGCCSFDEPVEDLLAMGLLDANGACQSQKY